MQDYIHFILHFRKIIANIGEGVGTSGAGANLGWGIENENENEMENENNNKNGADAREKGEVCKGAETGVKKERQADRKQEERTRCSVEELLEQKEVSEELKEYYNSEVETQLPQQLGKWAE
jgi:hypothetical protein